MNRVVGKRIIEDRIGLFVIESQRIAKKRKSGKTGFIRDNGNGESIPQTLIYPDDKNGKIRLIVQGVCKTTLLMNSCQTTEADMPGALALKGYVVNDVSFATKIITQDWMP
jgi:ferredoxin--NADP+ reductase